MKEIYANALLSDGKLLFWYIGSECTEYDFYKDFYYAEIDEIDYRKTHKVELRKMSFNYDNCGDEHYDSLLNNVIFKEMARSFFRLFKISPDSKGEKPY